MNPSDLQKRVLESQKEIYQDTRPFPFEGPFFDYELSLALEKYLGLSQIVNAIIEQHPLRVPYVLRSLVETEAYQDLTRKILDQGNLPRLRQMRYRPNLTSHKPPPIPDSKRGSEKIVNVAGRSFKIWNIPIVDPVATYHGEEEIVKAFFKIYEGNVVLDIGAACGSYALYALACGAKAVFAWSPENSNTSPYFSVLEKNIEINGWKDKARLFKSGLYDKKGYLLPRGTKPASFLTHPSGDSCFPVSSLDESLVISPKEKIDFIKIDAEGCEVEILHGGKKTILAHHPKILIENHVFMDPAIPERIAEVLTSFGYKKTGSINSHFIMHSLHEPIA